MLLAAQAGAAAAWTYAASEHFEVYTTGGDRRARAILVYFERVHAFFADFLKLAPRTHHPTRLVVFSNTREYEPYRLNEFATAYYAPGPDRDYIVMQSFDTDSYPVVVHEYAHLIAEHANAAYPPWLNEGIAEFFSTLTPDGAEMRLGQVPLNRLHELRTGGGMIDLDRLLAVTHASPEYSKRDHAGMFYAQSWALTHMIIAGADYRQKSSAFLASVGEGTPAATAFSAVYGKTTADVFRDLRQYLNSGRFAYFKLPYRDPKIPAIFPTRPATAFEAALVGANMLGERPDRASDARAAFEQLAHDRPDDRDLIEARAIFESRHGNSELAKAFLAKALAAKSENPAIYRWAAASATRPEEQEALLKTAVDLVPNDIAVRLTYASALMLRRDAAAARAALAPVGRVPPEHAFRYFELQASISLELGEMPAARAAAARAKPHAPHGRDERYIDDLIEAIEERAATTR